MNIYARRSHGIAQLVKTCAHSSSLGRGHEFETCVPWGCEALSLPYQPLCGEVSGVGFQHEIFHRGKKSAGVEGATMAVKNQCSYTIWAAGIPGGGKQLGQGETWTFDIPAGTTAARIWGRTGCSFDAASGKGSCNTGDCGGLLNCQGYGSVPATLFEYARFQDQNQDVYDISLVDGFNLPLSVTPSNPNYPAVGCTSDINAVCPAQLKVTDGCESPCDAFNTPQYCCTGEYLNNCSPNNYSQFFKKQCPQAYSYTQDDAASTSCPSGATYNIIFCGQHNQDIYVISFCS